MASNRELHFFPYFINGLFIIAYRGRIAIRVKSTDLARQSLIVEGQVMPFRQTEHRFIGAVWFRNMTQSKEVNFPVFIRVKPKAAYAESFDF